MKGWDGSVAELSVFPTETSATGLKIFPYEKSIQVAGTKRFSQNSFTLQQSGQNGIVFALYVFLIRKYANYLFTKVMEVDKATIVANDMLLAPICFCFSKFITVDRADISHMSGRQNSSQ